MCTGTDIKAEAKTLGWQVRELPFEPELEVLCGADVETWLALRRDEILLEGPLKSRPDSQQRPPREFDWRPRHVLAAPGNQGRVNACMSYATCAVASAKGQIAGGQPRSLAPRHLHFCLMDLDRDNGVDVDFLAKTVLAKGLPHAFAGADTMLSRDACSRGGADRLRVASFFAVTDAEAAKGEIAFLGPIVALMEQREEFSKWYAGGVYRATSSPLLGYHAVCLIGYSDIERYWIGLNSQGSAWGEAGFFRLAYDDSGLLSGNLPAFSLDLA